MINEHHSWILEQIRRHAGKPTKHTFLDNYLGNSHPRYAISNPELRTIAREFSRNHKESDADAFAALLESLIQGESATEKMMAGFLLDYATPAQRKFKPRLFNNWLDQLVGWAEIDTLCSSKYARTEVPAQWQAWEPLLTKFSKSDYIGKRRASLVLLCSPVRYLHDGSLSEKAFDNIQRLSGERDVLITKAISWLLRSMVKLYRREVAIFVKDNADHLPAIAVRETRTKLKTGIKSKRKSV